MIHDDSTLEKELEILKSQDRMAKILMEEDEKNQNNPKDDHLKDKKLMLFSRQVTPNKISNTIFPLMIKANTTIH